jgi:hypothetical protein
MKSLRPLVTLKPDESVTHQADWFLFRYIAVSQTDGEIETALKPLIVQSPLYQGTMTCL